MLYLFIGLILLTVVFTFVRAAIMLRANNNQSKLVHDKMIKGLLYADLNEFYNRVPLGRIVNRLTKDLRELDEVIMTYLSFVLIASFDLLGSLFICCYAGTPYALIPMAFVALFANSLRKYYLKTKREISRYEKSTNSPVVSGFMSTISGLSTIRAFKKEEVVCKTQMEYFDLNKTVRVDRAGLENWFSMSLAFLAFLIQLPVIGFSLFSPGTDPASMGLLMVYALNMSRTVVWLVQSEANFEAKLISIERIYKFMSIEPEKNYIEYCANWTPVEEA